MIEKNDDKESKEFFRYLKKASLEVAGWPCWKRYSAQALVDSKSPWKKCKDLACITCYTDGAARAILARKVKRLQNEVKKLKLKYEAPAMKDPKPADL